MFEVEVVLDLEFFEVGEDCPEAAYGLFSVVGSFLFRPGPWGSGGVALGGASCCGVRIDDCTFPGWWSVGVRKDWILGIEEEDWIFAEFDEFLDDVHFDCPSFAPTLQEGGFVIGVGFEECSGLVAFYIRRFRAKGHEGLDWLPGVSGFGGLL